VRLSGAMTTAPGSSPVATSTPVSVAVSNTVIESFSGLIITTYALSSVIAMVPDLDGPLATAWGGPASGATSSSPASGAAGSTPPHAPSPSATKIVR
jgi:hypothetical protein